VDAAKDDKRPSCMRQPAHVISAKSICRVDPDTDYVAAPYAVWVEWLECLVNDCRGAVAVGRGGGEDVEPSRRDDSRAEGHVARIDKMNAHAMSSERVRDSFTEAAEESGGCEAALL